MHNPQPAFKRILGGGFALATAAAFVVPGVASAADSPDSGDATGSLSSVTDMLGSSDSGSSDDGTDEDGADGNTTKDATVGGNDDAGMFGSVSSILDCALGGGTSDENGGTSEEDGTDDADATGSLTTIIDCFLGGSDDGETDGGSGNGDGSGNDGGSGQEG